ncbi:MAG: hypothetical protein M1333_03215 [Patescibacteria group bacterium]|nr:hypothetical protein [Patescibacteria group bacterium]
MKYVRLSLVYPAIYLLIGGLAAMIFPAKLPLLFFSTAGYPEVAVQFVGVLSCVLGFLISLIAYKRLEVLYLPLLWLRLFVGIWLLAFYFSQKDLMFLIIFCLGGFGVLLSFFSLFMDRKNKNQKT